MTLIPGSLPTTNNTNKTMKIKFLRQTILKRFNVDSSKIEDEKNKYKVSIHNNFEINWIKSVDSNHCQVSLVAALNGFHDWYVFKPDIDFSSMPPNTKIGLDTNLEAINLNIPYLSQRDNVNRPMGTCNLTCVAMCLAYFGVVRKTQIGQLEDELFNLVERKGWDRHLHSDLARVFQEYGVKDIFNTETTYDQIKQHLIKGNPVIISGRFTKSGHIILVRGFDRHGFFVNDPYGEWFASGYKNQPGRNLHYSYSAIFGVSYGSNKSCWAHLPKL